MDFILVLAKIQPKEGCQDSIVELAKELVYESLLEEPEEDEEGNATWEVVDLSPKKSQK